MINMTFLNVHHMNQNLHFIFLTEFKIQSQLWKRGQKLGCEVGTEKQEKYTEPWKYLQTAISVVKQHTCSFKTGKVMKIMKI